MKIENLSFLCLDDGTTFSGSWFGNEPPAAAELASASNSESPAGEVIFNTGMAGYQAIFTDPSYSGQILVMTYPHIGNYGTTDEWSESGPEAETRKMIKAQAVVLRSLYKGPVPRGRQTLPEFLKKNKVSGITEVDTRRLTLHLRDKGNQNGIIVRAKEGTTDLSKDEKQAVQQFLSKLPGMVGRDLVSEVGTDQAVVFNKEGSPNICLIDCGVKANIIRELLALKCKVSVVPSTFTGQDILSLHPEGVLFSNGPGDPAVLSHLIDTAKELIGKKPLFGICLGHQILSLALGAKTFKMKFGHHGVNHPVRDERTRRVLITSQNHGFGVDEKSLSSDIDVLFRNVNDNTIEGIIHKKLPILTAQFHPEAAPGPKDSLWIFREFLEKIG
ncbi:MAG: glutamine-hydrolyzing carbamoyl-phosphate synthase small subunit [Spirochaetales bacterium]|nr:glutamine-hydrolyzing carbamoyl-phosphate synthase small subunit [Spirochaetales bacterium]